MRRTRKVNVSKFMAKLRKSIEEAGVLEPLDWVLLILHAANGRMPSRIHVQKALFLASGHIEGLDEVLEFKAYRMGPWSEEVNDALEVGRLSGLVSESRSGVLLTETGNSRARILWTSLSERDRKVLSTIARFVTRMSEDELLLYVYIVYGYSEKSDILEKLLKRRKALALSMLRKGLVSVELAAKIAGEPLLEFIKYLRRRGVKPFAAEVSDIEEAREL